MPWCLFGHCNACGDDLTISGSLNHRNRVSRKPLFHTKYCCVDVLPFLSKFSITGALYTSPHPDISTPYIPSNPTCSTTLQHPSVDGFLSLAYLAKFNQNLIVPGFNEFDNKGGRFSKLYFFERKPDLCSLLQSIT